MPFSTSRSGALLIEKIRALLAQRGLTLADVARMSRFDPQFGPLHHVPHNLYDAIRKRQFSPSLFQLVTLSTVSDYRLIDWFALFGFSLDDVPRFQINFPALRTVELDARVYHPGARIPWLQDLRRPVLSAALVPLSQWLVSAAPLRFDSLPLPSGDFYRYVKIGSQDALAYPDLLPGSIVRVNPKDAGRSTADVKTPGNNLLLVEHSRGFVCSRVYRPEPDKLVLCSKHLPFAPVELQDGVEVSIIGSADLEIRPVASTEKPSVPASLGQLWKPAPLPPTLPSSNAGEFIRRARKHSGLSFQEASERTRVLARSLGDARYFCAPSSLSDCETRTVPPRHVHKLISICAVYFASVGGLLDASGTSLDRAGQRPMPDEFLARKDSPKAHQIHSGFSRFLNEMARRYGLLPYFLHQGFPSFVGLPEISIRDFFWAGGVEAFSHPYLAGALFLIVDRRKKSPRASLSSPMEAQPIYIVRRRDGVYVCGSCNLYEGMLVIRGYITGTPKLMRLRNRVEAEVVGRVVAIIRRLS